MTKARFLAYALVLIAAGAGIGTLAGSLANSATRPVATVQRPIRPVQAPAQTASTASSSSTAETAPVTTVTTVAPVAPAIRTCLGNIQVGNDSDCQTIARMYSAFANYRADNPNVTTFTLSLTTGSTACGGGLQCVQYVRYDCAPTASMFTCINQADSYDRAVLTGQPFHYPGR